MRKALGLGTILGGLTAFAWSMVSWEIIGWHEKVMTGFQNEDELSEAIRAHAPADGTYLLPAVAHGQKDEAAAMAKFQKGPIMVAQCGAAGLGRSARRLRFKCCT